MSSSQNSNIPVGINNVYKLTTSEKSGTITEFEMNHFLNDFNSEMCKFTLKQDTKNKIYKMCIELVNNVKKFTTHLINDVNGLNTSQALDFSTKFVLHKLSECSSNFKRCKKTESSETYVPPQQLSLGVRWDIVKERIGTVSIPTLVSCKYQYVPITQTIYNLFQRNDFRDAYLNYNASNENMQVNGVYTDFGSGSVFKDNELFQAHPNSLQIEMGTDEFEVCDNLGSKATLHKIYPVYFVIKNIAPQHRSKLNNIFIVALCNSDDLKTKYTDVNDIWRVIVRDISHLENGIYVGNGLTLKGTLVNLLSDNLGANGALGFVENFSKSHYYCRFCECNKDECKTLLEEIPSKRRSMHRYEVQINEIKNSEKVDYKVTKGVKRFCELTNLKYFDMFSSMTPDIMHDLNEGAIPFLMKTLFQYCISSKLCKEDDLERKIQFYDYGFTNTKNCPSLLNFKKKNLNQNANQSMCLFRHTPFILYHLRNAKKLKDVWICVESLLRITQIAYSSKIEEEDLKDLENSIQIHLEHLHKCFKIELIAKHHFITHYPNVIRAMGPLVGMSMMRFEAKHKSLKKIANETFNYVNLTKTLATKHQQLLSTVDDSYTDKFSHGKLLEIKDPLHIELLKKFSIFDEEMRVARHLRYNIFNYRQKPNFGNRANFHEEDQLLFSVHPFRFCRIR